MSDAEHLACIKPRSAYMDFRSLEESTGEVNAKYKLLTKKLAGVYFFHVLTKSGITYPQEYRMEILRNDWESREPHPRGMHLDEDASYLGCQHFHMMSERDVLLKRKEFRNGFNISGLLSQTKFTEVTDFIKRSGGVYSRKSNVVIQEDIESVFNKGVISDKIRNKLGL